VQNPALIVRSCIWLFNNLSSQQARLDNASDWFFLRWHRTLHKCWSPQSTQIARMSSLRYKLSNYTIFLAVHLKLPIPHHTAGLLPHSPEAHKPQTQQYLPLVTAHRYTESQAACQFAPCRKAPVTSPAKGDSGLRLFRLNKIG
jgi:hypothetical protein